MTDKPVNPLVNELRMYADDIHSKRGEHPLATVMSRAADAIEAQQLGNEKLNSLLREYAKTIEQLRDVVAEFTQGNTLEVVKAARHLVAQRGGDNVKLAFAELVKVVKGE